MEEKVKLVIDGNENMIYNKQIDRIFYFRQSVWKFSYQLSMIPSKTNLIYISAISMLKFCFSV